MKHSSLFHRRLLTVSAIILMVSSALISFFLVQENDKYINDLRRRTEKTQQDIRTLWENAAESQHTMDAAVIISLLAKDDTPDAMELKRYYLTRAGIGQTGGKLIDALKTAEAERGQATDKVNDLYESQLNMENEIMRREAENKRTADIAFLLQLISLVLIILTREMPGV